jgi:hypothetical protein
VRHCGAEGPVGFAIHRVVGPRQRDWLGCDKRYGRSPAGDQCLRIHFPF